jgi:hypothetical protein
MRRLPVRRRRWAMRAAKSKNRKNAITARLTYIPTKTVPHVLYMHNNMHTTRSYAPKKSLQGKVKATLYLNEFSTCLLHLVDSHFITQIGKQLIRDHICDCTRHSHREKGRIKVLHVAIVYLCSVTPESLKHGIVENRVVSFAAVLAAAAVVMMSFCDGQFSFCSCRPPLHLLLFHHPPKNPYYFHQILVACERYNNVSMIYVPSLHCSERFRPTAPWVGRPTANGEWAVRLQLDLSC